MAMKTILAVVIVLAALAVVRGAWAKEFLSPDEAAGRVAAGDAILIDVREPAEWEKGVVDGARLLSLSDLKAERRQWTPFLKENSGKRLIVYCRTGNRSWQAAKILRDLGFSVENAGGLSDWKRAGQPIVKP